MTPTRLYLDTARLGLMNTGAWRALSDFARLLSEEGLSLYTSQWLLHGSRSHYPSRQHPFSIWPGIEGLKEAVRASLNVPNSHPVLFASRARSLAEIAIDVLSRQCRRPLMVDLLWPPYQQLAIGGCRKNGTKPSIARIRRRVFEDKLGADEIVELLVDHYRENDCDGILLPSVSHDGVRLPVARIRSRIESVSTPQMVVVDGAQGFAHMDGSAEVAATDIYLASAHKWLRSGLPLGIAILTNRLTDAILGRDSRRIAASVDPLLRLSQELLSGRMKIFGETVDVSPLITCFGALQETMSRFTPLEMIQNHNRTRLIECVNFLNWELVETSPDVQSGVFLLRPEHHELRRLTVSLIRESLEANGIAATCYPGGHVRLSAPRNSAISDEDIALCRSAFTTIPRQLLSARSIRGILPIGPYQALPVL